MRLRLEPIQAAIVTVSLLAVALVVPVATADAVATTPTPAAGPTRAADRNAVLTATGTQGSGLVTDDASALTVADGCSSLPVPQAAFAVVAMTATAGARSTRVTLDGRAYTMAPHGSVSVVRWMTATSGTVSFCQTASALTSLDVRVLGHTVQHSDAVPGGLVNVSSRIPLTSDGTGAWTYPEHAVPDGARAVLVQISGPQAGVVTVTSGGVAVPVVVGPGQPSQTLLLPAGALAWTTSTAGSNPDAVLLGTVTAPDDAVSGGALITPLSEPRTLSGADFALAGKYGIAPLRGQIPPTGLLVGLSGGASSIADPLAAGRSTDLGATPTTRAQAASTLVRLANDGSFHVSTSLRVTVSAYLSGDVIRTPGAIDLTLPGSPQVTAAPDDHTLVFAGRRPYPAGQVLTVAPTAVDPSGVIAVVNGVKYSSATNQTTVTFHAGGLLDAFLAVSLIAQLPAPADTPPTDGRVAPNRVSGTAGLSFDVGASFGLGTNPSVTAGISFNLSASVTLSVDVNAFSFNPSVTMHYAVDSSATAQASVTAQGSWNGSRTFSLPFKARGAVALGPIVVVPQLSSSLTLSASVQASVTVSSAVRSSAHVGQTTTVSMRGMSTTKDSNNGFRAPSFVGPDLTASTSATADASVAFTLTLAVSGVAGPFASASVGVRAELTPGGTPAWRVFAYADFQVGIDLNALNIGLLTSILRAIGVNTRPSWQIGHLGPYEIRRGNSSSGGGVPGVGGETGGSGSESTGGGGPGGGGSGGTGSSGATTPAPAGATVTVGQGPSAPYGYRYAIGLSGFRPNTLAAITCKDSADPGGFYYFSLPIDGNGNGSTAAFCYSADGPEYWVDAGGLESNHARWSTGGGSTPPSDGAHVDISWSTSYPGWVTIGLSGFGSGSYGYTCHFGSGGDASFTLGSTGTDQLIDNGHTCFDRISGDTVQVIVGGVASNTIVVGGAPPAKGVAETVGGYTNTWTDYTSAGGSPGPAVEAFRTVMITCAVQGFRVADGNTWWYRINTSPWSDSFYASADAFYNNGQTSGSLRGTPFVDPAVPSCTSTPPPPAGTWTETVGGNTNTWTNYTNAGGTQGATIGAFSSVQIACALNGFRVANGNTWWYRIASSPWNSAYYASADAFYNNGQTSGSLHGTPWVDPAVPLCSSTGGTTETTGGATNTWTNYTNAGGSQGPTIGANASVTVACRVQGFRVTDGNTWWYRIASSPWNNAYYASADAFYNNGQTSGSLTGTPFVDENVPSC